MRESSRRLMALLAGERVRKPPFFEPWFAKNQMLESRYGGNPIAMVEDLDLAAWRLPGVSTNVMFRKPVARIESTGVYYGGGALTCREQLAERPEPDWDAQVESILPQRERLREAGIACWLVLPWCFHAVATSMGLENFALACLDDPELIADFMAFVEQRNEVAIARVVAEVDPDFVLYDGDCAYKTGTMIRPELMRELCEAPTRRSMGKVQELGLPIVFHTDGQLDEVIPLLLDLGVAAVHGCEAQANQLWHLVEKFGDEIVLCGNQDVVHLHTAAPAEVRASTERMLLTGARLGRFVAGCNTSPQDYLPDANYLAFADTIRCWRPPVS